MTATIEKKKRKTARRGNGEGSIYLRKDGRWGARIAAGYDQTGKRLRREVLGKTKKEVADKLQELLHRKQTGTLTESSKITVATFLDRWLDDTARLTVRDSSYRRYRQLVRVHVNTRIGGVRLQRLTASDVQSIFSTMEEGGSSARTRQFVHDVISMALDNAVKLGLVVRNVCDQLTRPRATKPLMKVLDSVQAQAFLKAAEADRLSAMYVLALTMGMRQGELFALQWADVDLQGRRLSVRYTLTDKGELVEPKTAKSRRQIDLPTMVVDALWTHKASMMAEGFAAVPFVFCDSQGGRLRTQNILRRSFRPILIAARDVLAESTKDNKATFPAIRFHDLRHSAATLMLLGGINAKVVSETLGHATVAFTLDTYAHVLPSQRREAADTMDRLLRVAT